MPGVAQGLTLTRGWVSYSQIQSLAPDSDGERQPSKTAQREVTPQLGGRERLGQRPSVMAAMRLPGAVTLRSGQFTFGCFQSIKAPCLEMRVLADLTPSVEFKGLCNSLVWNRVWAWLRKTLEPISARSSCSALRRGKQPPFPLSTADSPET